MAKRRPNGYVALDVAAHRHPKFLERSPAAVGLWAMGLSYCGDNRTDGLILRPQVPKLVNLPAKKCFELAEDLVAAGLWTKEGEHFRMHDYLDWNLSRGELDQMREQERDRKAHLRSRKSSGRVPEGQQGGQ